MKKEIEIQVSLDIVKQKLRKALEKGGEPHADLITKIIIENLEPTEMGVSQLLMSFMGVEEEITWVVGDECMVHPDKISSWSWDQALTAAAVPFHKGHVKGKIKHIDLRKKRAITFIFQGAYSKSNPEIKELTHEVKLGDIKSDDDLKLVRPDLASLM